MKLKLDSNQASEIVYKQWREIMFGDIGQWLPTPWLLRMFGWSPLRRRRKPGLLLYTAGPIKQRRRKPYWEYWDQKSFPWGDENAQP